jgi:molybdopterin molybdotransferase
MRGNLRRNDIGFLEAVPISETDSSHSSSLALADVLIVQPEDSPGIRAGDIVDVIPLNWG